MSKFKPVDAPYQLGGELITSYEQLKSNAPCNFEDFIEGCQIGIVQKWLVKNGQSDLAEKLNDAARDMAGKELEIAICDLLGIARPKAKISKPSESASAKERAEEREADAIKAELERKRLLAKRRKAAAAKRELAAVEAQAEAERKKKAAKARKARKQKAAAVKAAEEAEAERKRATAKKRADAKKKAKAATAPSTAAAPGVKSSILKAAAAAWPFPTGSRP
jgi:hypothetical protein